MTSQKKDSIGIRTIIDLSVGAILLVASYFAPAVGVLDAIMMKALLMIFAAVWLWVRHPIPVAATSLFILVLLPSFGLTESLSTAFAGYSNSANFFVIASFGVSIAIRKTSLSGRILRSLLKISKGHSRKVVLAYMLMVYVISAFMSDIAAVVIGLAFAQDLLDGIENEMERKQMGKVLMLAVPFAAVIGGTATPAGSTVNIMALNIMSANTGIEVSFLQWCIVALPVSAVLIFAAWCVITALYKPVNIDGSKFDSLMEKVELSAETKLKKEGVILAILAGMIVAWIAGSWISALNTTTVAVIGLLLMMSPGIAVFDWTEYKNSVPWEIFLMGGATVTLGTVAKETGLVTLFADKVQGLLGSAGPAMMVVVIGVVVTFVLMFIPAGPTCASMLTMAIFTMASNLGINPVMCVIVLGAFASNTCILPLNAVMLLSYSRNQWKVIDLVRAGLLITVVWILIGAIWYPLAAGLVL